ncbi:MAG: MAPEG family protein [Pseudomonadota bacterium]
MQVPITALYAGVLALFAFYLSARAGRFRGKAGVSILYGDPIDWTLAERVRTHQNFLEYVPIILVLMGLIELNSGSSTFLYAVGSLLVIARIAHAVGLKHDNMAHKGRFIGAAGTALIMIASAVYSIWLPLAS